MPFHRILIPTDFSTASEWVFDDAIRLARAGRGELIILHVRMTWASNPDELRFPADPSLYEYVEKLELDRLRERVERANGNLSTRLIVRKAPHAGNEICRTAVEEHADLIVIATHARHHVPHLFVGSTTTAVLQNPPAPVLAIRYGIRKRSSMDRVVVPIHAGQTSHRALDLAIREGRELHLITVCKDEEREAAEKTLQEAAQRAPSATTLLIRGTDPEQEIIRYSTKSDADAIFLNAAASPSHRKLEIVRHAPVPVMLA